VLSSWAKLEPYLIDDEPSTRWASLRFTYAADRQERLPVEAAEPLTISIETVFANWDVPSNVLGVTPGAVAALTPLPLPDGRALIAASSDSSVRIWDPVNTDPFGEPLTGKSLSALAVVPLPDERVLLAVANSGVVLLWDPVSTEHVWNLRPGGLGISELAAVPLHDGEVRLAVSVSGQVWMCNPVTGEFRLRLPSGRAGRVTSLAVLPLPDERVLLAVGGACGSVGVWDPLTRDMVTDLSSRGRNRVVTALAVPPLPDERVLLAVGGVDGSVQLWDPVATKQVWNLRAAPGYQHWPRCRCPISGCCSPPAASMDRYDCGTR
jgi:WD40 repeat protein